jgi:histidinol-phosphate aminotransferase
MFLNKFVNTLKPYTVSSHEAWNYVDDSEILKLDWNEATVKPSSHVMKCLLHHIETGRLNWYPDVDNSHFRTILSSYVGVGAEFIEYFASSDALHEYIIRGFINSNDVITMISPTYDNFRAASESVGAIIDYFDLDSEDNFSFCLESFKNHLYKIRPKVVYLCNPNNPTGTLYSVDLIEQLIKQFNDVLFVIDEAYFEFSNTTCAPLVENYENVIITRTFSKAFALASFRVGYAISSVHNINGLRKIRNPKNISSASQIAAVAALEDIGYMTNYVNEVLETKSRFIDQLRSININVIGSESGNYILINFGSFQASIVPFLEKHKVFVRNYGHVHGMSSYTRITVGTKDQMERVFSLIQSEFLKNP